MLIDTHAHLYWESFKEDFDQMIQRAVTAGISTIVNIGVDIAKSQEALNQAKNTNWPTGLTVYSTIGIHPHEAIKYPGSQMSSGRGTNVQDDIAKLEQIYQDNPEKVVGVGECGLDYFQNNDYNGHNYYKKLQKKLFQAQIDLAKKLNLPLIVHCRDDRSKDPQNSEAWDKVLEMVGNHPTILHCYSGLPTITQKAIQKDNILVAFAANITYPKNEYLREAAKILPLEKILLETDSPFLAPQFKRGQRNEPAAVSEIAQLVAELKGISFEEVAEQTTKNAQAVFMISSE